MNKVLNVGGNSKEIAIASQYDGWQQDLLDIDASQNPDILADARELTEQQAEIYDAVYCSHNLEHYYLHDAKKVLIGFRHVLKPDGHAYITVPDLKQVMAQVVNENLDITDVLYQSQMGPIHVYDVLYGHQGKIECSGEEYFAQNWFYPYVASSNFAGCRFCCRCYLGVAAECLGNSFYASANRSAM